MIPEAEWRWFGCAGHLIVASDCLFHLHTRVGNYRISTIGDYRPRHRRTGGQLGPAMTIGLNRLYETYVFNIIRDDEEDEEFVEMPGGKEVSATPGEGVISLSEIDSLPANDEATATANHMAMCRKYAAQAALVDPVATATTSVAQR